MKVLVTGAAGFVGSHLAERLAELGYEVVGVDCFTDYYSPTLKRVNAAGVRSKGVRLVELDLAVDGLADVVAEVDLVYHLAAQPGISATVPLQTYVRNNIVATHRLLEVAKTVASLKCFINISTSSVYGAHATDPEEAPPKPTSYYGVTKLAAEQLALAYHRQGQLPACSLRLFSVYGPRERPEKLYHKLIHCILEDKPFPLYKDSRRHSRSFTFIDDAIEGLTTVLADPERAKGEIFNIGSDAEVTTGEGIDTIEAIIGREARKEVKAERPGDQLKTRANIDKARRLLGYEPKTGLKEGLKAEVDWYKEKVWRKGLY